MDMETGIEEGLRRWFGHESFRSGQREAVEAVLGGHDAVVVMPTGSGKSLCYQLAAMLLPGTTLVISPLIALMKDQVDGLTRRGCPATYLNSTLTAGEMGARLAKMVKGEYKLVYIAPERFRVERFMKSLRRTELSLLTIDEAHCISQWGHDFRPDYLEIQKVLTHFPELRVMAVTATATPDVRADIRHQLGLGEGGRTRPFEEVLGFARPNLHIAVTEVRRGADKFSRAVEVVGKHRTGVIYVATRKHALDVYTQLTEHFLGNGQHEILMYHGAMDERERAQMQERFMQSKCPVVVATNAFGMGVDRADIRFVLHWDMPGGIEAYYQEIGRAGRDGCAAWCELLFNHGDVKIQEFFNEGSNPTWHQATQVLDALKRLEKGVPTTIDTDQFGKDIGIMNGIAVDTILNVLQSQGVLTRTTMRRGGRLTSVQLDSDVDVSGLEKVFETRREKALRDEQRLRHMVNYCHESGCRHAFILRYFGDKSGMEVCGGCDNCVRDGMVSKRTAAPPRKTIPFQIVPTQDVHPVFDDMRELLRRYVAIQGETRRLEEERLLLRDRIAERMKTENVELRQVVLDGERLQIRCQPKTVYVYDEQLLRRRLGNRYETILEPDTKRMKGFLAEVTTLLRPLLGKIGVPSRERIREEVEKGHIDKSVFVGAFTRREDLSFSVTHPKEWNQT